MKGAAFRYGALGVLVCGVVGVAAAQPSKDVTDADRMWANYTREAAVVGSGRVRLEVRGIRLTDDDDPVDLTLAGFPVDKVERDHGGRDVEEIEGGRFDLVASYGLGANAELGFDLPFAFQERITFTDDTKADQFDVGDLVLYGKFKRQLATHCAGAIGLELSAPTGPASKGLGSGELGLNPFLSTRYQQGRLGIGAHTGFQINTEEVPDVFNWSVQGVVRGNEHYAIRTEVLGRLFRDSGETFNDIAVYPGIDFNLSEAIIIRPEGLAHITDEAIDWGIGVGIALVL